MKRAQLRVPILPSRVRAAPPRKNKIITTLAGQPLTAREMAFAREYLVDFNGTRAMQRAGGYPKSAHNMAYEFLRKPNVAAFIARELQARRERAEMSADEVAAYWHDLAHADIRELTPFRYGPCRYCWGEDHEYQYTQGELRELVRKHYIDHIKTPKDKIPVPNIRGGDGYDRMRDPMRGPGWGEDANSDHNCPECAGIGVVVPLPIDFANLSRGALLAYEGVRFYRDGSMEVRTRSRTTAMENYQIIRGLMRPKRARWDLNFDEMEDGQLDALLAEARQRGLLSGDDFGEIIDATVTTGTEVSREKVESE